MEAQESNQDHTSQTTGKQAGNEPEWYSRINRDIRYEMSLQINLMPGEVALDAAGLERLFRDRGLSAGDGLEATNYVLARRRGDRMKRLSGSFPRGMRDGLKSLSERLPGAMARHLGETVTLSAVLLGPTGCGKTTAAGMLVLRSSPDAVHWCYATDLAMADRYHKLGEGEPPAIREARKAPALVLDDIGVESSGALWTILNHRYHEGLPTIATSGLTRDELTAALGAAAVRRLRDQHAGHEVLIVDCHEAKR